MRRNLPACCLDSNLVTATREDTTEVPQKIKQSYIWSGTSLLDMCLKETKDRIHAQPPQRVFEEKTRFWKVSCSQVCTGQECFTSNKWKQTKGLPREAWVKKWHVHNTMWLSQEKERLLWFSGTQIKLGDNKRSEESQNQKNTNIKYHLKVESKNTHSLLEKT